MPLTTTKNTSVFTPAVCYENSSALFAFNVCSKTNHRGRLAVAAPGCTRLIRSLSLELETFDGLADGSLCRMLADKFC
jgi:hypothetical protein